MGIGSRIQARRLDIMVYLNPTGSPAVSAPTDTSSETTDASDSSWQANHLITEVRPAAEFRLALAIYAGWSALVWLSQLAGTATVAPRAASILLLGIGATNALFFMLARTSILHRPPADTIALAQSVVGIAWATLFASMSSGTGELIIGMYASILVFAMLRVRRTVLIQIAVFAVISYSIAGLINGLSAEPVAAGVAATLVDVLTFAGIMLCLSCAGQYVYRRHAHFEKEITELRERLQRDYSSTGTNSVNRRYILDLLTREKGRTDRSNVPFCVCVFTLDHLESAAANADQHNRQKAMKSAETIIRRELRDMDSFNSTGFHDCFGPYSDKEYIAILPQTNLHGAQRSTQRVLTAIATQHNDSSPGDHITLCGGIAEYRRGEKISSLLARAEDALGEARESGVSRVCSSGQTDTGGKRNHADVVRLETRRR